VNQLGGAHKLTNEAMFK